jgi:ribosome-binding ATPase YchF (GTP1/OBG family)
MTLVPDTNATTTTAMVALAGNPNTGKSTIFNALTGMAQHVGNYPGVTVEKVVGRMDTRPNHPKASDAADPLHAARAAELTSLWRLAPV